MRPRRLPLIVLTLLFLATPLRVAADFVPLGDLPGGDFHSDATSVSADGSTVVGWSFNTDGIRAFRWTAATGMVNVADGRGVLASFAQGVSADGSIVVGDYVGFFGVGAFRWTETAGLTDLPWPNQRNIAYSVSTDGRIIAGASEFFSPNFQAVRWTAGGSLVPLGSLSAGPSSLSLAYSMTSDGRVVVGVGTSLSGSEAFRWTESTGMVGLGDLPGGSYSSSAFGVSADGSVVVGRSNSSIGLEAFRWTEGTGMVGLGFLPGFTNSIAEAVSADGTVVVGGSGQFAFIWDAANGMRSLQDVLIAQGNDLAGWRLTNATGISADGKTVAGTGVNPAGKTEAFLARLNDPAPIPEPGSLILLGLGLAGLVGYHYRWPVRAK